jgi:hypothetical protein
MVGQRDAEVSGLFYLGQTEQEQLSVCRPKSVCAQAVNEPNTSPVRTGLAQS